MGESQTKLENHNASERVRRSDPEEAALSAFLKFPSLNRLFQEPGSGALEDIRSQLSKTNQYLERVIRQGTKADAEKAIIVSRSFRLTLSILEELELNVNRSAK